MKIKYVIPILIFLFTFTPISFAKTSPYGRNLNPITFNVLYNGNPAIGNVTITETHCKSNCFITAQFVNGSATIYVYNNSVVWDTHVYTLGTCPNHPVISNIGQSPVPNTLNLKFYC